MKAAIYARKSNDDDRIEENKSITRQKDRAIAFAEKNGWTVDVEHVFEDDGISGAEYERRPGLIKMLARIEDFDVIVMSEISRLGRDMVRNAVVIDDIRAAGVRLFYYLTNEEEFADTPEQRVMVTLKSFAAEMERARISERTRDALLRRAEKGYSTGGRVYGYDNYWVLADGRRIIAPPGSRMKGEEKLRTEWGINEEQAAVVRGIFLIYADGYGHGAIAKCLNGEPSYENEQEKYFRGRNLTPPQHAGQGTGSWAPSTIRAMLYRPRYTGSLQYGEYRNVRSSGRAGKCVKQDKLLSVVTNDKLAIIEPALWDKVQKRLVAVKGTYLRKNNGTLWGRPDAGRESKYLLSGLARCGCENRGHVCGGNITITGGQKRSHYYYGCSYHQNRGSRVCSNDVRERMAVMDELVLGEIERVALSPEAVDFVVDEAVRGFETLLREKPEQLPKLEADLRRSTRELGRFTKLIADGRAPKTVLVEITQRERHIETLRQEIERYRAPSHLSELDLHRARKDARVRIGQFKDLLRGDISLARQALRKLLRDREGKFSPLTFVPVVRGTQRTYNVRAAVNVGPLFNKDGTEERT